MTLLLGHYEVDDFDTWKRETFDADPGGRRQMAKGHVLSLGASTTRTRCSCESSSPLRRKPSRFGSAFSLPEPWMRSP